MVRDSAGASGGRLSMSPEKCASCGSTENVLTHHLSYEPEITVPLCRSCHGEVHFSKKPAKAYEKVSLGSKGFGYFIRDYLVAREETEKKAICYLCAFGDSEGATEAHIEGSDLRQALADHMVEEHQPVNWSDFEMLRRGGG